MAAPEPFAQHPHAAALDELVVLGMNLARAVAAEGMADPTPANAAAFDGLARTVRRTIHLARRLAETPPPDRRRAQARARILREVEDAATRTPAAELPERLRAELDERIDDPNLDTDIDTRPIEDIVTEILRDLGLADTPGEPPWPRRTPAVLHELRTRATRPGAIPQRPYLSWPFTTPPPHPP